MVNSIGKLIKDKRNSLGYSLRKLARDAAISVTYLSDIETGRRVNIGKDIIDRICNVLAFSNEEIEEIYSLLGKENGAIPNDVEEFIKNHPSLIPFLREAKRGEHEDWLRGLDKKNED